MTKRLLPGLLLVLLVGFFGVPSGAVTLDPADLVTTFRSASQVVVADVTEATTISRTCFKYQFIVVMSHPSRVDEREFTSNRPLTVGDRIVITRHAGTAVPLIAQNAAKCRSRWYAEGYFVPEVFPLMSLSPSVGLSLDRGPYLLVEAGTFAAQSTIRRISISRVAMGADKHRQKLIESEDGFLWSDVIKASLLPSTLVAQ